MERLFRKLGAPSAAYWPLVAIVLILCITFLISAGHVREVLLSWSGGHAVLGKGGSEDWKNLVAEIVNKSEVPLTIEVGLFLHINDMKNIEGQTARNIAEICAAISYAHSEGRNSSGSCLNADFSRVKMALLELKGFGFLESVQFVRVPYVSYQLNTLGNQAFDKVRSKAAAERADFLTFLDFDHAGLRGPVLRARAAYAEALANDKAGPEKLP